MTQTRDIIERAFRKLRVVATDEPMTADQADAGLATLNQMMHGWKLMGIDLSHVDLGLTDDFSMDAMFHEGAIYQLCQRLSPEFSEPAQDPDAWFRALQTHYATIPAATIPLALRRTSSQDRWTR